MAKLVVLATLVVQDSKVVSQEGINKFDPLSGLVIFNNPSGKPYTPVVSDISMNEISYITDTHFIRAIVSPTTFTVWSHALDTGNRNNPPHDFTAIVVGMDS